MELNSIGNLQESVPKNPTLKSPGGAPRSYFSYHFTNLMLILLFLGKWGPMRFFLCSLVAPCFAEVLLSIKYFWPRHRSKLSMGQKSGCLRKGSKVLSVDRICCFLRSKGLEKEHSTNDHYWTSSVLFTLEQFILRGVCSRILPIVIVQNLQRMGLDLTAFCWFQFRPNFSRSYGVIWYAHAWYLTHSVTRNCRHGPAVRTNEEARQNCIEQDKSTNFVQVLLQHFYTKRFLRVSSHLSLYGFNSGHLFGFYGWIWIVRHQGQEAQWHVSLYSIWHCNSSKE